MQHDQHVILMLSGLHQLFFGPENMEGNPKLYVLSEKVLLIFLPAFILLEHASPEKHSKVTTFSLHL